MKAMDMSRWNIHMEVIADPEEKERLRAEMRAMETETMDEEGGHAEL